MNMLLIDGAKYNLWTPEKEEEEFHPIIKEHSREIFGENSLYVAIEEFLISVAGRGAMPDGFAIVFSENPEMYVVEIELSSHDLDKHIVEQVNRFVRALKNPENRKRIADDLEAKIRSNPMDEAFVKQRIGSKEIYKFILDLVSQNPKIVILIENKDDKLLEAFGNFIIVPIIKEFKTFVRENTPALHAHLFEPMYPIAKSSEVATTKAPSENEKHIVEINEVKVSDTLEIEQKSASDLKYHLFRLTGNSRLFFPGYKKEFVLETDIGDIKTWVTSAYGNPRVGDPTGGTYMTAGLKPWFNRHPEVTVGRKLRFQCVEPYRRYKLSIAGLSI